MDEEENRDRGYKTWVKMDSMVGVGGGYWTSEFRWTGSGGEVDRLLDLE